MPKPRTAVPAPSTETAYVTLCGPYGHVWSYPGRGPWPHPGQPCECGERTWQRSPRYLPVHEVEARAAQ